MSFRFRPWLIGASLLSTSIHAVLAGESTVVDESSTGQLDDVIVTAQRRAESIQDVPTTVTAVSGNTITSEDLGSSAANVTFLVANTSSGTRRRGLTR